ncbi:EAL domain-containing protein [Vibrio ulleungensis]|uniref:EAL domain-containing protein n=1 Tax=Vibrio ulleungensis TaxID=2807619 RepID=A0ABS2HIS6_9VIBR|nr:EAL domain-containing protein [Vibrio ulleungensis]MBM7037001.1 EAL domain-containing protein [Vibrio ulleungensis]
MLERNQLDIILENDRGQFYAEYRSAMLTSVFQPIFDRQGNVFGYEALLRIINQRGEHIRPDLFFSSQKISSHDKHQVEQISRQLHLLNFRHSDFSSHHLFLNVLPDATHKLSEQLERSPREFNEGNIENIVFEFVEFAASDEGEFNHAAKKIASNGSKIAVDDYGIQHSNKRRVDSIEPQIIKFDRSLLRAFMQGDKSKLLDGLKVAKSIQAKTVIEGIESASDMLAMQELGFNYFQGFYLALPQTLPSRTAVLRA